MLSPFLLEQHAQNRRTEKGGIALPIILRRVPYEDYEDLLEWLIQSADLMKLCSNTKFLARTFFDIAAIAFQDIPQARLITVALAALAIAVKFNERRQISEQFTLENLLKSVNMELTKAEYIDMELRMTKALRFRFRYTAPLDYLEIFLARFPFYPRMRYVLPKYVELAMLRPSMCEFTAQEIFFGAVVALCEIQEVRLDEFRVHVLESVTDCWQGATRAAAVITEAIMMAQGQVMEE